MIPPLFITNNSIGSIVFENGSKVQINLNPPIQLDPNKKYCAAAVEVDIVYCFPNIITGQNDTFYFSEVVGGNLTDFTCQISQGLYDVAALQDEINRWTQEKCQNSKLFVLEADPSSSHVYVHFMTTTCSIDCTGPHNVMTIIGYPFSDGILTPVTHVNDFYEGAKAQLNNILNVYLKASFVSGSYMNSQNSNILASITPDVDPFSTIMYRPQFPIFVPISDPALSNMTFQLVDQNNNPINVGVIDGSTDVPELWSARIVIREDNNDNIGLLK